MGKNDNLIEDYRNIITNMLLNNEVIVDILGEGKISLDEADILIGGDEPRIQPYEFIPNTITKTGSYIMYDLDEEAVFPFGNNKSSYTEVTLYMWVVSHRKMMRHKGRLRNDVLTRELKKLFGEENGLGIAKNHFVFNKVFDAFNNDYSGRVVKFVITDWSDKIRKYARANV